MLINSNAWYAQKLLQVPKEQLQCKEESWVVGVEARYSSSSVWGGTYTRLTGNRICLLRPVRDFIFNCKPIWLADTSFRRSIINYYFSSWWSPMTIDLPCQLRTINEGIYFCFLITLIVQLEHGYIFFTQFVHIYIFYFP